MNNIEKNRIRRGNVYPLGFSRQDNWMQFTAIFPEKREVKLQLWKRGKKIEEIILNENFQMGDLYSVQIPAIKGKIQYTYEVDGVSTIDPCAKKLYEEKIGEDKKSQKMAGEADIFDWQGDTSPKIPYKEMFLYRLHVRGFTKHPASNIEHKGTFLGLCEKIPYLKELGVNAILLMPCYEFEDFMKIPVTDPRFTKNRKDTVRNYWGYGGEAWYFVPKRAFCNDKRSPENEFRYMIKKMHENGIEILMEFSFTKEISPYLVIECLRYWVMEYHIDGIYFNDNVAPIDIVAKDPILSNCKLIAHYWNEKELFKKQMYHMAERTSDYEEKLKDIEDKRQLANYHDGFLIAARCFLKGDQGHTKDFADVFRRNTDKVAQINYIADNNGFTLADLVSYNQKHNEANGEGDHDGVRDNYSWNCGQEGKTKKRLVMSLRERQKKNAMLMLFLSQGVPMLYAGDEFGNSQDGNNNAYCQDNKTGWISWDQKQKNEEFFEFVKKLIAFRKQTAVLKNVQMLTGQDNLACGCPDISWHGQRAWYPDFTMESRLLGVLLNGKYTQQGDHRSIYIVFNMNWEDESIGFPRPDRGWCWKLLIDTAKTEEYVKERQKKEEKKEYYMKARSVAVFVSEVSTAVEEQHIVVNRRKKKKPMEEKKAENEI